MKLAILVLEDEREVRAALERDLEVFARTVRIEPAQDVEDAREVLREIRDDGDELALVLADHRLPGTTGVDFLCELAEDPRTKHVAGVLVTGQADHDDTIRAVNSAGLRYYIAKPWEHAELEKVVRECLTEVVAERRWDPMPHLAALDPVRAMEVVRRRVGD